MPCCPHAERRENATATERGEQEPQESQLPPTRRYRRAGDTRIHLIWNETPSREPERLLLSAAEAAGRFARYLSTQPVAQTPREAGETVCTGGIRKRAISSVAHCDSDRAARCRSLGARSYVVAQLLTGDSGGCPPATARSFESGGRGEPGTR